MNPKPQTHTAHPSTLNPQLSIPDAKRSQKDRVGVVPAEDMNAATFKAIQEAKMSGQSQTLNLKPETPKPANLNPTP
jgi:hypothetical protein